MMLDSDGPESFKSNLRIVVSESRRAAKVIKNLQLFARRSGPGKTYVNVNSILQRAVDLKVHDYHSSQLTLSCNFDTNVPCTMIDEQQLVQVIVNILTNAQQSLEETNKKGHVSVQSILFRGQIRISIEDNGAGIPKDDLGKIFEPFFTTKEVGPGTGLGLSICYGIVQQNGGYLWAESTEGAGATFHIELPILATKKEDKSDDEPVLTSTAVKRILAVDDEPEILFLLCNSIEQEQFSVDLAKDGADAWQLLQENHYHCILLDLKMPKMDGQELYQLIEEFDSDLATKVIFISGDTVNSKTYDFVSSTGNPVINKPFQMAELRTHIVQLIEQASDPAFGGND